MLSNQYSISNSVKQGGCLSSTLFSIYLNDLIDVLRSSNIGCRYGIHYMGVYCYADDIGLLSPTLSGLKEMLKLCEDYALKHTIILMPNFHFMIDTLSTLFRTYCMNIWMSSVEI